MLGSYDLAATSGKSGFNPSTLILILIVVVAFYFLMIRPQQRRKQQAAQKQNTVTPGAQVRTTAGMYATVVAVDGDDVILEVAPGIEVRYMKRAVMDVVSPGETVEEDVEEDVSDEDTTDLYEGEDGDVEDTDETADTPPAPTAAADDKNAYEQATGTKKD
ncbi:MAG TPA: preprotein translocase subunit YajC [Trebonia sp.]|jgi:preprotein translocase subunit YajC|nr:preprotein translocase subunit YajC [Trebonia sp.]